MTNKMTRRLFFRRLLTTPDFFFVLAKHLDEVFPNGWIYEEVLEDEIITSVDSTYGWNKAFKATCEELELNDCYSWYGEFDWYEGDLLDSDISELLVATVFDDNGNRIYYPYND